MKDKRRNSEKRKEKSRDAARCRRSKESEVFFELAEGLPLPSSVTSQMDKASVMRLAISFLKMCEVLDQHDWAESEKGTSRTDGKGRADQLFPKALDGFVFILSSEGDIVYVNESVAKYLGIQQIELMGQSIFEFAHPRDEDEIREALSARPHRPKAPVTEERVFFLRMKCTLTAKGRNINLKSASYKVIKCTGRLVMQTGKQEAGASSPYLLAIGEPIPHPANIEMPMDRNTFLSKHGMNMHFTFCDERVKELIGYNSEDLEGKSVYDYHHAVDSDIVEKAYKDLLARGKGQTMTGQYRFLARGGGWVWVVTQATVIYNSRSQKAQWVVCVNYVLSEVEHKELILSEVQLPAARCLPPVGTQLSMESLFTRKTEDMNQGYFIPAEMRDKIKMTEDNEPEDLSFLAPVAGDGSVVLGFPSFAQVAGASLQDNDRSSSSPPALLKVGLKKEPSVSPALCRTRDQDSIGSMSPASSGSSSSSRISSPPDYRKAASPYDIMSMGKFFQEMDTKADGTQETEVIDFDSRAPYIPMSGDEDLTLLPPTPESLLTLQSDIDPGLFGKTEFVFKPKTEDIFAEAAPQPRQSVRDMIGGSTAVEKQPPDIMFQQIKRPLDMNSLEKGPPAHKVQRMLGQDQIHKVPTLKRSKDSVLLNLLLTGEDPNGYRVVSPSTSVNMLLSKNTPSRYVQSQLLCLTTRDCEVNAPTHSTGLLQGAELLKALEIGVPQTPR